MTDIETVLQRIERDNDGEPGPNVDDIGALIDCARALQGLENQMMLAYDPGCDCLVCKAKASALIALKKMAVLK